MDLYPLLVFFHVLGAVGLFAALGIEAVAVARLGRTDAIEGARDALGLLRVNDRLGGVGMLVLLASGAWMMALTWGAQPWLSAAFVAIVFMGIAGGAVSSRRIRRLRAALAAERGAALSEPFRTLRSSVALTVSLRVRLAIGVGILALMTLKPAALGSALLVLAAVAAGLVASLPLAGARAPAAQRSGA